MGTNTLLYENDSDIIREYCDTKSNHAANAFVRKYQKFVFATALRYIQNETDADDISQEVFIKAFNNLHKFRGDSSISTWLYRITQNTCANYSRKKKLLSMFVSNKDEELTKFVSKEVMPDHKIENEEFNNNFLNSLNKLPKKQRETFALRYFEELTYVEISKMLGTSVGGLKANYFQAVKKLSLIMKSEK